MINMHWVKQCGPEHACTTTGGSFLGVLIGFLCPYCVPASAAFFASIGLAAMSRAVVIYSLVGVFSVILILGLIQGFRRHGDISPLLFGILGMVFLPLGRYVIWSPVITYTAALCIVAATLMNWFLTTTPSRQRVSDEDVHRLLKAISA